MARYGSPFCDAPSLCRSLHRGPSAPPPVPCPDQTAGGHFRPLCVGVPRPACAATSPRGRRHRHCPLIARPTPYPTTESRAFSRPPRPARRAGFRANLRSRTRRTMAGTRSPAQPPSCSRRQTIRSSGQEKRARIRPPAASHSESAAFGRESPQATEGGAALYLSVPGPDSGGQGVPPEPPARGGVGNSLPAGVRNRSVTRVKASADELLRAGSRYS